MKQPQSITTLAESPEVDRHRRMIRYAIAMGIRVLCVIACFFVHGWWLLVPIAGAVILPYVAVVIANVGSRANSAEVLSPGSVVPYTRDDA